MMGLSKAATNGLYGSWFMPVMMGNSQDSVNCSAVEKLVSNPLLNVFLVLYLLTWLLIVIMLAALIRFLWKRAGTK